MLMTEADKSCCPPEQNVLLGQCHFYCWIVQNSIAAVNYINMELISDDQQVLNNPRLVIIKVEMNKPPSLFICCSD